MTEPDQTLANLPSQPTLPQGNGTAAFVAQRFGDYELRVIRRLFKKPIEQHSANRIFLVEHAVLREQIFRHKNFHVR